MAHIAKRPRRSDDYDSSTYYDNVPGTSLTRPSAGPSGTTTSMAAPGHPTYLSATYPATNGVNGSATSPHLTSHRPLLPGHQSSGAEDNNEDMAPPKSTSTSGTRGRGRGRGRPRGSGRGRGRPRTSNTNFISAHDNASYSDEGVAHPNGHVAAPPTDDDGEDDSAPNPLVFQCRTCYRLLGDSFSFVATDTDLGYVILSDVSEVVTQDTSYSTSTEPGKDIGSTFARLRCAGCQSTIGRNYRTTPRDLDDLRDCFSLEVDKVFTYQLGSNYTKQLESDEAGGEGRGEKGAQELNGGEGGLESKMERTRAFTIELSDRLIQAEEDIRRYSALVQKLMEEKAATAEASTAQENAQEAQDEQSELSSIAEDPQAAPAAAPTTTTATAGTPKETGKDVEEPTTPPPTTGEAPQIKQESQRKAVHVPTTRSRRSGIGNGSGSPNVVVLLDGSNEASY